MQKYDGFSEILEMDTLSQFQSACSKQEILKIIFPFLLSGPAEEEEYYERYGEMPCRVWNGYKVIFVIDWNQKFSHFFLFDFVTKEILEKYYLSEEELLEYSRKNLERLKIVSQIYYADNTSESEHAYMAPNNFFEMGYGMLKFENSFIVPNISTSMLLLDSFWNEVYKNFLFSPFYVAPILREYVFVISTQKLYKKYSFMELCSKKLKHLDVPYTVPFSNDFFFYNGKTLKKY